MGGVPRLILLAVTGAALVWAAPAGALDPPAAATPPTITKSQQPSPGTSRSLTFEFTGDSIDTFECRLDRPDATAVEDWTACDSPKTYMLADTEPDGDYTFRVRAIDPVLGQSAEDTAVYTLDTTGPTVAISSPPTSPGTSRSLTYGFTSEPDAAFECRLEGPGATLVEDWTTCDSGKSYTLDPAAPDGGYVFAVRATDTLGNVGTPATHTYTLDTTGPSVVIVSGPGSQVSDSSVSFSFTTEAGAATVCRLTRDGATVYDWVACTSPWAYGLSTQPDGNYRFEVRGTDALGNPGGATTLAFTLNRPQQQSANQPTDAQAAVSDGGPRFRPGVCINLFNGTTKSDVLTGTAFGDVLLGFAGNDRLAGEAGDDCVLGDDGNDHLSGGDGNDDVRGLAGDDVVRGDAGNDHVRGGSGSDAVTGGPGKDVINGGPGRDRIFAADGERDTVDCGSGRDSVTADRSDKLVGCEKKKLRGRKR